VHEDDLFGVERGSQVDLKQLGAVVLRLLAEFIRTHDHHQPFEQLVLLFNALLWGEVTGLVVPDQLVVLGVIYEPAYVDRQVDVGVVLVLEDVVAQLLLVFH